MWRREVDRVRHVDGNRVVGAAGLFFCVGFIQLGRHRIAFWWVLIGILAQGGVLAAAWRMAALAGPIN